MAFQGKGILGGFSGKVGNVVGFKSNNVDIIRTNTKKGLRSNGLTLTKTLLTLTPLENATVGTGFVSNNTGNQSFGIGAYNSLSIKNKIGGWYFRKSVSRSRSQVMITEFNGNINYLDAAIAIRLRFNRINVIINGLEVLVVDAGELNENYALKWHAGVFGFYRSYNTGKLKLVFEFENIDTSNLSLGINTEFNNTTIDNVSIERNY